MAYIEKIAVLLCIAASAYGASIVPMGFPDQSPTFTFLANSSPLSQMDRDHFVKDIPLSPTHISLAEPTYSPGLGKVIAQVLRTMVDIFERMEVSEQTLKDLIQMIAPVMVSYYGPQSQLFLPVLTGIATAVLKSLAAA